MTTYEIYRNDTYVGYSRSLEAAERRAKQERRRLSDVMTIYSGPTVIREFGSICDDAAEAAEYDVR